MAQSNVRRRRTAIHEDTQRLDESTPSARARERSETRPAPGGGAPCGSVARGEATPYALNPETEVAYLFANGVRLARLAYEAPGDVPSIGGETLHVFFELGDHLGSTSVVLDKATGELVERSTYQAYGGSESDYRPERWKHFREDYRFTGKKEDVEVGLIYFGKRFLNPLLNRWVSADPLAVHGLGADPNLYAYVSGSVLQATDPNGLCSNGSGGNTGKCDAQGGSQGAPSTSHAEDVERANYKKNFEEGHAIGKAFGQRYGSAEEVAWRARMHGWDPSLAAEHIEYFWNRDTRKLDLERKEKVVAARINDDIFFKGFLEGFAEGRASTGPSFLSHTAEALGGCGLDSDHAALLTGMA